MRSGLDLSLLFPRALLGALDIEGQLEELLRQVHREYRDTRGNLDDSRSEVKDATDAGLAQQIGDLAGTGCRNGHNANGNVLTSDDIFQILHGIHWDASDMRPNLPWIRIEGSSILEPPFFVPCGC